MLIEDYQEYTNEQLKALHEKSLEMAEYFVNFCNENGLLCYFCGGGCIGAIRHKGFIPWDDDLDFFMPRADYEKLAEIWNEKADMARYSLNKPSLDFCDHNSMITIKDEKTTFIKPYQSELDISQGLPLDVFPLDGCAPRGLKRKIQLGFAMLYSLFATQVIPEKHGGFMKFACTILLGIFRSNKVRYRIWRFCERQMSKYNIADSESITELCAGPHYMKKVYPAAAFAESIFVPFEETKMPVPKGYDDYLKTAFGDYMTLPPEDKQKAHHECTFMDLNNSYKNYKGKYYCTH